jgi:murein tripeptide amidase MpaA
VVIAAARVHAGETNCSWMMQGFINFLVSDTIKARELRSNLIFKIIPMLNIDGVVAGNYRSSFSGSDLNRQYISPDKRLHPTIYNLKKLIRNTQKQT